MDLKWNPRIVSACPMEYAVRYREINTFMYDSHPGWIEFPQVTNNFRTISLDWDKEYEIAVKSLYVIGSTEYGSDWSISWNIKTPKGMTLRFVWCLFYGGFRLLASYNHEVQRRSIQRKLPQYSTC